MGSENPRDWLGEFCINLSSGRWSAFTPNLPSPAKATILAHHHVTKIVHGGNKAEAMAVNEVVALALLSFLPHLRYV